MAEVLKFDKKAEAPPVLGGFVSTPTTQNIMRTLELVDATPGAITVIAAAPGIGKTTALRSFWNRRPGALMVTAVDGEGGTWGVACQLMQILDLGVPNSRNLMEERQRIAEAIGGDGLLLIDEAQYLVRRNTRGADDWSAFDWLRAMSEEAFAFPIAFVGDLSLLELADKRGGLWRRAGEGRRLVLRSIERGDVEGLAANFGLSDPASVEALYQIARREGGLGYVATIAKRALQAAGLGRVEGAHVLAAIEYLNLNRLGAK
ncbi:MAG: AAA family ATPase [Burkholderiaceae bacterium]|nr:AAA family ATPase [Burkholderiaceae bacterium]